MKHDLVIRNGQIVDGTGNPSYEGDVAVQGDTITALGKVPEQGVREIDAAGAAVTPGFVDLHTHLDAQLFWDPLASPCCWHGTTSVVIGNCSVTFAPVREGDVEHLARTLESVELSELGIELPKGAVSRLVLNLAPVEPKEGHPDNRTIAVVFPGPADTLHERQAKVLAKITGARDELKSSAMDAEIIAARRKAQQELAALAPAFAAGLAKHETLLVKAPFATLTGGQEWMWVEIQGWEGKKITGILQNDPQLTQGIQAHFQP